MFTGDTIHVITFRSYVVTGPNSLDAFISTQVLTELSNTLKKKFKLKWQTVKDVVSQVSSDFNLYINKTDTIESANFEFEPHSNKS